MSGSRVLRCCALALAVVVPAACSRSDGGTTGPPPASQYRIAVRSGNGQTGLPGHALSEPLEVTVTDAQLGTPAKGVAVQWRVTSGSGATLSPTTTSTDSTGGASTVLTLGSQAGDYGVTATVANVVGGNAVFTLTALSGAPDVTSATPSTATAGDTITVRGQHFGSSAEQIQVLFSDLAGEVLTVSDSVIRTVVPPCLPTRQVQLLVARGAVASSSIPVQVTGRPGNDVSLPVGGVLTLTDPSAVQCLRFSPQTSGTRFLLAIQNASTIPSASMPFRLAALAGSTGVAANLAGDVARATLQRPASMPAPPAPGAISAQDAWELHIRELEQQLPSGSFIRRPAGRVRTEATTTVPSVGDQRQFEVINKDNTFTKVTAVVKYVGEHGIIYQDLNAPAGGFTDADFQHFSDLFDNPIYPTDTTTFGAPSDIDGNGHVIILLTPVVNELTPKGSQGFVAGFFYGNDLTTDTGSNHGEIFYSMVPDPDGKFGDPRATSKVLDVVPPTLAHEFMHMIHFNQRVLIRGGHNIDVLWLSEGLAHMAEDIVGQVFADRGDATTAAQFQGANYTRAYYYLASIPTKSPDHTYDVSLLSSDGFGSLEQRGAAWLVLKYLVGHDGIGLLKELVQTTLSGTNNVSTHVGVPWGQIYNEESVALYADDDPELSGVPVDSMYTFSNIDLRKKLYSASYGGFALQPKTYAFQDFGFTDDLPASAPYFIIIDAGNSSQSLSLGLSPENSASFAAGSALQLAVLRLK